MTDVAQELDVAALQRRTVASLVAVQAVGALGITIGIATASLLAEELSGSEKLAGLAQTFQVLGASVASYALARHMSRHGRRRGLVLGYTTAAVGAVLVVTAGGIGSMSLLLVGMVLLGAATASNSAARYAATDLATDETRARALSVVVWATTIGAVAGPNLTGPAAELAKGLDVPESAGPFALAGIGLALAAVVAAARLRPDPLLTARALAHREGTVPYGTSWGRVMEAVRERPVLAMAAGGMAAAHATMVAVMVMTPLHMKNGGADLDVVGVVISVHVLGMFAFSPLVGAAADRFGRVPVLVAGGVVLLVSLVLCALAPEGSSWQIFAGLFLLGLGWSFATIAASTMIADHAPLDARADVQGAADMGMGLTAAAGSALAGVVVGELGYPVLAAYASVLAAGVLVTGFLAGRHTGTT